MCHGRAVRQHLQLFTPDRLLRHPGRQKHAFRMMPPDGLDLWRLGVCARPEQWIPGVRRGEALVHDPRVRLHVCAAKIRLSVFKPTLSYIRDKGI